MALPAEMLAPPDQVVLTEPPLCAAMLMDCL